MFFFFLSRVCVSLEYNEAQCGPDSIVEGFSYFRIQKIEKTSTRICAMNLHFPLALKSGSNSTPIPAEDSPSICVQIILYTLSERK